MATVVDPKRSWNRAETDQRVRHPLQRLRSYIRTYVTLEGAAIFLLYLTLWFWIGLLLDFGVFKLFSFDWVQQMPRLVGDTFPIMRIGMLVILVAGLLALVAVKVILRIVREFRDPALALVLERRFPRQLGDRLITAVEMADPALAAEYGHSQPMVDQTIQDAATVVDTLAVKQVFNWKRLYKYALALCVLTVGLFLLVGVAYCLFAQRGVMSYFYRFRDVAAIWTERNLLLQDSLWPRRAYLEVIRYKGSQNDPREMRIPDGSSPELWVRSVRWVIADPKAPEGWRAMRWKDVEEILGRKIDIPLRRDWDGWIVDLDELNPKVEDFQRLPESWRNQTIKYVQEDIAHPGGNQAQLLAGVGSLPNPHLASSLALARLLYTPGFKLTDRSLTSLRAEGVPEAVLRKLDTRKLNTLMDKEFDTEEDLLKELAKVLDKKELERFQKLVLKHAHIPFVSPVGYKPPVSVAEKLEAQQLAEMKRTLFDWHNWTLDRIDLQIDDPRVFIPMGEKHPEALDAFGKILDELEDLAYSGRVERKMRRLEKPETVNIRYYGETILNDMTFSNRDNQKYYVNLGALSETVRFYVQAEDFYTSERKITLVPRPRLEKLELYKEEPAYRYYRMEDKLIDDPEGKPQDLKTHLQAQLDLRNKFQQFAPQPVSISDQLSRIEVPMGSHIHLVARVNEKVLRQKGTKGSIRLSAVKKKDDEDKTGTADLSGLEVILHDDNQTFTINYWEEDENGKGNKKAAKPAKGEPRVTRRRRGITRPVEFIVHFVNVDNVEGQRQIIIEPKLDKHPDVNVQMMENVFRKQRNGDAYLITPMAKIPFKGSIVDDVGLNRVEWVYRVTPVKVGANLSRVQLLMTMFRFSPHGVSSQLIGPPYLAWHINRLKETSTVGEAESQPIERKLLKKFVTQIEERRDFDKDRKQFDITPEGLPTKLQATNPPRESLVTQLSLRVDDDFFSFEEYLQRLKTLGESALQPQYDVELWMLATDNNVENTQAVVIGKDKNGKDKLLLDKKGQPVLEYVPVTSESKQHFFFRVVGEDELMAEISREEEDLAADMEKVYKTLTDARIKLDTQVLANLTNAADRNRQAAYTHDVRNAITMSGKDLGTVYTSFSRIQRELEYNQVGKIRVERVAKNICAPLGELLDTRATDAAKANFHLTADAAQKLQDLLEDSQKLKDALASDKEALNKAAQDLHTRLELLMRQLKKVMDEMSKVLDKDTLIRILVEAEQEQRTITDTLKAHLEFLLKFYEKDLGDDQEDKKDEKANKKEEKKGNK
jgi:hypothetical protein